MSLRDVNFKRAYDSDYDDILNDFFIKALSESVQYRRLAGFFSSSTLAIAARGIVNLIQNNGSIQLVVSPKFEPSDWEIIQEIYQTPEKFIERKFLEELDNIEKGFVEDHVRALGWMLKEGKLAIRVAFTQVEGEIPDPSQLNPIFHLKVGILEDSEGNCLSFSGSDNETLYGWTKNIEEFKVFRSWIDGEREYFLTDEEKFKRFWENRADKTKIIELPEVVRRRLVDISPANISDLDLPKWSRPQKSKPIIKKKLRGYQNEAISSWCNNGYVGVFEMATGTGKTFTAINCITEAQKQTKQLLTVISCPTSHLIRQWESELREELSNPNIVIADSSNPKWKKRLQEEILDLRSEVSDTLIVLTSHITLSRDDFQGIVFDFSGKKLIVADEAHWLGAPELANGLNEGYELKLGLSATPARWWDDEGTGELLKYFGQVVYSFPLKRAINEINPDTGETYLTPYYYKPSFTDLTDTEFEEYYQSTKKLARMYHIAKNSKEKSDIYIRLLTKRRDILRNAEKKYDELKRILTGFGDDINHCLIYCSPQQMGRVIEILEEKRIKFSKFTGEEDIKPKSEYSGLSERQVILRDFADGKQQILVGIKCLDEGVDVRPTKTAILMSSTGNPREYIQRRGRVLRRFPGKEYATIYDIIVVPSLKGYRVDGEEFEIERNLIRKEMNRFTEFFDSAINQRECILQIRDIEDKYDIFVGGGNGQQS